MVQEVSDESGKKSILLQKKMTCDLKDPTVNKVFLIQNTSKLSYAHIALLLRITAALGGVLLATPLPAEMMGGSLQLGSAPGSTESYQPGSTKDSTAFPVPPPATSELGYGVEAPPISGEATSPFSWQVTQKPPQEKQPKKSPIQGVDPRKLADMDLGYSAQFAELQQTQAFFIMENGLITPMAQYDFQNLRQKRPHATYFVDTSLLTPEKTKLLTSLGVLTGPIETASSQGVQGGLGETSSNQKDSHGTGPAILGGKAGEQSSSTNQGPPSSKSGTEESP